MSEQVISQSLQYSRGNGSWLGSPSTWTNTSLRHWRYISSYHGPWLQLPPEVLESLAYSNFYSPRPQPIDPAVFFDLVKIRRLIEDATSLAVRAANGTTSAALSTSLSAGYGIINGSDAEILGFGVTHGGANAKLSRERKHRMREHATQKLSHAYHLDEIAASVATMQSASALEEVAKLVLQRNEKDPDAQYVHFFHEKIPSRAMAECTSLDPLNDIIRQRPTDGAPLRTRAVTRIFKEDFLGAARDLTEGLAVFRLYSTQHRDEQRDLILARDAARMAREYRADAKVDEKDQPSSLGPQLLFHRGGTYLTLACDQIERALQGPRPENNVAENNVTNGTPQNGDPSPPMLTAGEKEEHQSRFEARKLVRTYAKRALRDYTAFLSHFDYTPGLPAEFTEAFLQKVSAYSNNTSSRTRSEKLLDIDAHSSSTTASDALIRYENHHKSSTPGLPPIPKPAVHRLDELFAPVPPTNLPPYPPDPDTNKAKTHPIFSLPDFSEAVTYHPLLTDVLHSLLLCHCLIQTSPKELLRHAHMAARIARVCDGYPIFLAARSPARADWVEVVRRARNWVGLETSWETLCTPAPVEKEGVWGKGKRAETAEEKRERVKREAIRDALADERVVDEETFRASVRARELRAVREEEEEQRKEYLRTSSKSGEVNGAGAEGEGKKCVQEESNGHVTSKEKEYPITTERAEAIARWIREAGPPSAGGGGEGRSKKGGRKARAKKEVETEETGSVGGGLERSVESLDMVD
jgi:hypothetical protein